MKLGQSKNLVGVIVAWVAVYALFAYFKPQTFLSPSNLELMMRQSIITGIAAIGMTYVIITQWREHVAYREEQEMPPWPNLTDWREHKDRKEIAAPQDDWKAF